MIHKITRVAIADDHQLFRTGLAQLLSAHEDLRVVLEVSNGQELLDQVRKTAPHVVLLDLEMPVMDGKQTLLALAQDHPKTKVIILTMHQHDSFIVDMMEGGASGYLLKDSSPEEVTTAIRTVMAEGLYFNSRVSRALLGGLAGQRRGTAITGLPGDELTQRDIDILRLICQECTTAQIADQLFLSPKTIEGYRKSLLEKTGSKNAAGLAVYAVKNGLV